MKFTADIQIITHQEILEPQGNTIARRLKKLNIQGISEVRVGKFIRMELEAETETDAHQTVNEACTKLLANPIIESYAFHLSSVEEVPMDTDLQQPEAHATTEQEAPTEELADPVIQDEASPAEVNKEEEE